MTTNTASVLKSFLAGHYGQVIDLIDSQKSLQNDLQIRPYWVGALVFTGQLDKANAVFASASLDNSLTIASRFFLMVGLVRQSRYREARALLVHNVRELNDSSSALDRFYIFQGIAFFRFFYGRFYLSEKYARRAFQAAVQARFIFGEMIAKDLLAHCLIQLGSVRQGLSYFEETLATAQKVKNEWLIGALQISLLKFRAQHGIDPATDLARLEEALPRLKPEDTYSSAELLLEIVRQSLLRGEFSKAESHLQTATEIIYKHQNRRQMALLNLRMSYMIYLQAHTHQALHVLRFAEQYIDASVDLSLWTQATGLKILILHRLRRLEEAAALEVQLREKTHKVQTAIHQKMIARRRSPRTSRPAGEDLVGDLLDKIAAGDPEVPRLLLHSGYYGLLHKAYRLPFGAKALIFDLMPNSLVVLDRGNVSLKKKRFNSLLRKIILLIKDRPRSKEDLVREIWGYQYDPLRHDPLIYSSINKLRKLIEPHADWIVLTEAGYQMQTDVKVILKNGLKMADKRQAKPTPALAAGKPALPGLSAPKHFKDLNFRQLQVLDYLKKNKSISIFELASKLEISKPTATRDLSHLYKLGIVKRAGKGRATRYFS